MASHTKFVPPAKSGRDDQHRASLLGVKVILPVNLSNFRLKAMLKKNN